MARIVLADWLPDYPDIDNPGATVIKNLCPCSVGYTPVRALSEYSGATTNRVLGAASGEDASGNVNTFCGDSGKLYKLADTTWNDVSKIGGYSTASGERWRFARFGDLMIATNFTDDVQTWTLGTSTVFADLGSTVPKARYLAIVRDHLVLANTNDTTDGAVRNRVWFSPIGDPADNDWGNTDKQSDFQTIYAADEITGIVGGEYGLVFTRDSIFRMTYTGDDRIFIFEEIDRNRGCVAPGSLVQSGGLTFFLAEDGFYAHDGNQSVPIGTDKIDRFFKGNALADAYENISAATDPERKLYLCSYANGSNGDYPSRILFYRWDTGRWSLVEQDLDLLVNLYGAAYTLEQLDNVSSSIDALPESLDSRAWAGGGALLGAFKDDRKLHTFGGSQLAAVAETAEAQPFEPRKSFVRGVVPVVEGAATVTVQMGTRESTQDSISWGSATSVNSRSKAANFRSNARYQRVRLNISGDNWTRAIAADVDAIAGERY